MSITDKQFLELEKRVRGVETALSTQVATCQKTHEHTRQSVDALVSEFNGLSKNVESLQKTRDKNEGMKKGAWVVWRTVFGLVMLASIILNIYLMLNGI